MKIYLIILFLILVCILNAQRVCEYPFLLNEGEMVVNVDDLKRDTIILKMEDKSIVTIYLHSCKGNLDLEQRDSTGKLIMSGSYGEAQILHNDSYRKYFDPVINKTVWEMYYYYMPIPVGVWYKWENGKMIEEKMNYKVEKP